MIDNTRTPTHAQIRDIEEKLMLAMAREAEKRGVLSTQQASEWVKKAKEHAVSSERLH